MSNWDFGIEKEPPNRPRHLIVNHFLNSPFANLNFHRIWRSGDFVSWWLASARPDLRSAATFTYTVARCST